MNKYSVRFSQEEAGWLEKQAARRRTSVSEVIRQALRHEMASFQSLEKFEVMDARFQKIETGVDAIGRFLAKQRLEDRK